MPNEKSIIAKTTTLMIKGELIMTLEEIDIEMTKFQEWLDTMKKDLEIMDARIKAAKAKYPAIKPKIEDTIPQEDNPDASKKV